MERRKKSGQIQIPTFGNWDYTNELPITQYFESARQAGLLRYNTGSSSSSSSFSSSETGECGDLYVVGDFIKPPLPSSPALILPPTKKTRTKTKTKTKGVVREKRRVEVKSVEEKNLKKGQKVRDVMEPPPTKLMVHNDHHHIHQQQQKSRGFGGGGGGVAVRRMPPPKPVDEDLYKISPDLLHTSKRKKMLGFFSRCLYPTCVV